MSQWMDRIVAGKLKTRKEQADLPFEEKIEIMEKLREMNNLLAENPLRKQPQSDCQPAPSRKAE